ncbi:MAG: F0F1 ATP synthase subunit delta [Clostridia bacterium]|nr:F0F1 ATP synthase subunit delta [Clostridia bacterium]
MKQATILCASNVTDNAYNYICRKLTEKFGETACTRTTDATLLGGFIVLLDGKIYDMSLRTQLSALRGTIGDIENKG